MAAKPGLLLRLALALALTAAALTAAVEIHGVPLPGDLRATREIQAREQFASTARLVNTAGDWNWIPFIAATLGVAFSPAIGHARDRRSHQRWQALWSFAAALALRGAGPLLKWAVDSPRPVAELGVRIDRIRDSAGFPSGHVYGDLLLLGVAAVFAPCWLPAKAAAAARVLALAVIALAGPARVYAGAHWPSDVAGGYLFGSAALALALAAGTWAAKRSA